MYTGYKMNTYSLLRGVFVKHQCALKIHISTFSFQSEYVKYTLDKCDYKNKNIRIFKD